MALKMHGKDTSGLSAAAANYFRIHKYALAELPPPDAEWTIDDVPFGGGLIQKFHSSGLINRVRRNVNNDSEKSYWETTEIVWQLLKEQELIDDEGDPTFDDCGQLNAIPCGGGFENLGTGLKCKRCGQFYSWLILDAYESG